MIQEPKYKREYRLSSFSAVTGLPVETNVTGDKNLIARRLKVHEREWAKNPTRVRPVIISRIVTTSYSNWTEWEQ